MGDPLAADRILDGRHRHIVSAEETSDQVQAVFTDALRVVRGFFRLGTQPDRRFRA